MVPVLVDNFKVPGMKRIVGMGKWDLWEAGEKKKIKDHLKTTAGIIVVKDLFFFALKCQCLKRAFEAVPEKRYNR
jgi:hypothetical protein